MVLGSTLKLENLKKLFEVGYSEVTTILKIKTDLSLKHMNTQIHIPLAVKNDVIIRYVASGKIHCVLLLE